MAGGTGLRSQHRILETLANGPADKTAMLRALGWSVFGQQKQLDVVLYQMRAAGMVRPARGTGMRGKWELEEGLAVCSECAGRGVIRSG